jgi:hypothetical protein
MTLISTVANVLIIYYTFLLSDNIWKWGESEEEAEKRPCHSSCGWLLASHHGGPGRVRGACWVCGGQSGIGVGFLRVLRFPLPIIPPISPSS